MGFDASSLPFGQSFQLLVQSHSSGGSSLSRVVSTHPVVYVEERALELQANYKMSVLGSRGLLFLGTNSPGGVCTAAGAGVSDLADR